MTFRALLSAFPLDKFTITMQCPIDLDSVSEPEPGITVVEGQPEMANGLPKPSSVRLVGEVSDSSIAPDRDRKVRKYADAGISDCWIISLNDATVEVYREPSDGKYSSTTVHRAGDVISPITALESPIRVSDLLPPG